MKSEICALKAQLEKDRQTLLSALQKAEAVVAQYRIELNRNEGAIAAVEMLLDSVGSSTKIEEISREDSHG